MEKRERLKTLLTEQKLGVLSTCCEDGQPYSSLIAFAASEDFSHIWFATKRDTQKFKNISLNPRVSLLIEDALNRESDFDEAAAATVLGTAKEQDKETFLKQFENKLNILKEFVENPETALLCLEIKKVYLVDNFQQVTEIEINV